MAPSCTTPAQFVSYELANGKGPSCNICPTCTDRLFDEDSFHIAEVLDGHAGCGHVEKLQDMWEVELRAAYAYLAVLNTFLKNDNHLWRSVIRNREITNVTFRYGTLHSGPTVALCLTRNFASKLEGQRSMASFAREFLKKKKILEFGQLT